MGLGSDKNVEKENVWFQKENRGKGAQFSLLSEVIFVTARAGRASVKFLPAVFSRKQHIVLHNKHR